MLWQREFSINQGQYYISIDASRYSISQKGFFNLPVQNFENSQILCLSFSYQLNNFWTLNIYVTKDSTVKYLIWSTTYTKTNSSEWQTDFIDIYSFDGFRTYSYFEISFEAIRDSTIKSSINLDNIKITKSFCHPLR
jgi:hypothetical protein